MFICSLILFFSPFIASITMVPCASDVLYQTDTPNPLLGLLRYLVLSRPVLSCPVPACIVLSYRRSVVTLGGWNKANIFFFKVVQLYVLVLLENMILFYFHPLSVVLAAILGSHMNCGTAKL